MESLTITLQLKSTQQALKGWKIMFDMDGDGDIDQFDEELTEYELQLMEDEMMYEEMERRRYQKTGHGEDKGKSCGLGVLIVIGFIMLVFSFAILGSAY